MEYNLAMDFTFKAELWEWKGKGAWVFASLPVDRSTDLKLLSGMQYKNGFGSLKVEVNIGSSVWLTSIFPDSKSGCYLLPIKKEIRMSESVATGDEVKITLRTVNF